MILKTIEIQGFKSFADKTVIQFGKGVTAVVGPNGSGKSNISDAVRWVLGEQSTKNLRGQSMEDVIFNGTGARRAQGFAEVTLTIDNTDRSLNFDSDTVAITRRYYRSHESEYLINKASVRLRDVNELFMDTGVGRDGYSMIGQGKIDSIVSSRSDERREIFEEASGISKYRYRKTDAERKLSQADDNLVRLNDIMAELESRVGPLKTQSEKAERFLKLADEKKTLDIGIWLYNLDRHNELMREQERKIILAKKQYDDCESEISSIASSIENNSSCTLRSTEEIEAMRSKQASYEEDNTRIKGEIALLENTAKFNNESAERMADEIDNIKNSDINVKEEIERHNALIEEKRVTEEELKLKISQYEEDFKELLINSENISSEIENEMNRLSGITAKISDTQVELVTSRSSVNEINERRVSVNESLLARRKESERLAEEMALLEDALKKAEEIIEECRNSLAGLQKLHGIKNDKQAELSKKAEELGLDIEAKRRRVAILQDLERNMEGFSHSVKAVIKDAGRGIIRGVIGTVNSVINVKPEYANAIEVALGNALQDIVVETEADAKRAINYLKKENKGRATFLPVSSIVGRTLEGKNIEESAGYLGLACDLVEADGKYREIIKSLLGRIAVCEDLDDAVSMAKKNNYKFKIVTLDGQIVHSGGSLTGGSMIKNGGILSRSGDIEKLSKEISADTARYDELCKNRDAVKAEVQKLDADITAANAEIINSQEDKIRVLGEIKRVGEQQQFAEKDFEALNRELLGFDSRLGELTSSIERCEEELSKLADNESAVRAELDKMSAGRNDVLAKREAIQNDSTAIKLQLIEVQKDIEAHISLAENLEKSTADRNEKIAELENSIEELKVKNTELAEQISAKEAEIENNSNLIAGVASGIEELIKSRENSEHELQKLRNDEREKTAERERLNGEVIRLEERKESMLRDFDEIIRRLFDEYELTRAEAENIAVRVENITEAKRNLAEVKGKIKALGNVSVSAIEEYKEVNERYLFMKEQISDVERSRAQLTKLINELTEQMKEKFISGFDKINSNFSKTFSELFGGGKAELTLTDPENILESGIDINVKLPGKNVPSIDALSGGEKALIAISIYFAIMRVSPPPFCFLDEVDTALDDINVDRFADYMHQSEFGTQFICVTHRRGTMEAADMLYGVTMQEKGVTKLLQLNVDELVKTLKLS